MYTSQQKHFKFQYSGTVLFICDVSCLCRQKQCMLFLWPPFFKKGLCLHNVPKCRSYLECLNFEGNACNCEILKPSNHIGTCTL